VSCGSGYAISALAAEHATAASAIDRALMLNPNSAYAWSTRGIVSYYQNRPGPTLEAYERAMRLSPLDPSGYVLTCGLAFAHVIGGRYAEAMEWVDRSLRELPRYRTAVSLKVILCVHFGLMEEAHEWLGRLLQIVPGLTIAGYKSQFAPIHPPEILVRYVEGLRNAGLPDECLLPV